MTEEYVTEYYNNHSSDYVLLGQIELFDDHYYAVEQVLGDLNLKSKAKNVTVELCTRDEGDYIPHVHVYNNHFNAAIRLDKNEYFIHGKYQDTFNDNQAKLFDVFMREKPKNTFATRWETAVTSFNYLHEKHQVIIKVQPDYTMINYTKDMKPEKDKKNGKDKGKG